ncbi:hypothetical protein J1N35_038560 [Gossypium stocksii]|uniref:Uncharacterized protein n=1 Tax=Gossypium stocksii TaxID=47602 RepID=A0A9D3ZLY7_9ROSI|nr:hypothetical protein J1N35_038560 [Gossypium stocksii]
MLNSCSAQGSSLIQEDSQQFIVCGLYLAVEPMQRNGMELKSVVKLELKCVTRNLKPSASVRLHWLELVNHNTLLLYNFTWSLSSFPGSHNNHSPPILSFSAVIRNLKIEEYLMYELHIYIAVP